MQTDGIAAASAAYIAGVSARSERETDGLFRLIRGLGEFTSALQSVPADPATLGRAERGIFVVRFDTKSSSQSKAEISRNQSVWHALKRAEVSGYIRTVPVRFADQEIGSQNVLAFRMHRRFAPHFRFSFRGAYEPIFLPPRDLWALCDKASGVSPSVWVDQMLGNALFDVAQLALPYSRFEPVTVVDGEIE